MEPTDLVLYASLWEIAQCEEDVATLDIIDLLRQVHEEFGESTECLPLIPTQPVLQWRDYERPSLKKLCGALSKTVLSQTL